MSSAQAVALMIDPPSHHFLGDRLFTSSVVQYGGNDLMAPYVALRARLEAAGVAAHTIDRIDRMPNSLKVVVSLGGVDRFPSLARRDDVILSAFFAMECPIVEPSIYRALPKVAQAFRRVYSWTDSESLLPFTRVPVPVLPFCWPQSLSAVRESLWARVDRKFLVMINANKLPRLYDRELYTERLRAVEFFQRYNEIDLYGRNWKRMPNRVGQTLIPATARRVYRVFWEWRQRHWPDSLYAATAAADKGPTESKLETLSQYTFALCFENMAIKGWITEKLFDCLFAGTVPVYWGATDIAERIPANCYVDRREFSGYSELRGYLRGLDPADVQGYRDAGRAFIESERFLPFATSTFVERIVRIVSEDADVERLGSVSTI